MENKIPFTKIVQLPGEMIFTGPMAFHAGFNSTQLKQLIA